MLARQIVGGLRQLLAEYPVVTMLAARQSRKTTLAPEVLNDHASA